MRSWRKVHKAVRRHQRRQRVQLQFQRALAMTTTERFKGWDRDIQEYVLQWIYQHPLQVDRSHTSCST